MGLSEINTPDGIITAYLAAPAPGESRPGQWPGVVIVHDALGLDEDIHSVADRFAMAGYFAIAPDLYSRGGFARCGRSVFRDLKRGEGQAFDDIDAARTALAKREDCTGKIAIVGFCVGGDFAIAAAYRGFDAVAPYYGQLPMDESILDSVPPVVASFGKKDRILVGTADKLSEMLHVRGIPHDVKEYPDAGHSFANRLAFGPLNAIAKVAGFGYHHESSEDAWRRVMTFFGKHLC